MFGIGHWEVLLIVLVGVVSLTAPELYFWQRRRRARALDARMRTQPREDGEPAD